MLYNSDDIRNEFMEAKGIIRDLLEKLLDEDISPEAYKWLVDASKSLTKAMAKINWNYKNHIKKRGILQWKEL